MGLEERLTALEAALSRETEKRKMLVAEVLVLRSALIGIALTTDASGARHTTAKSQASDRLAAYLIAAECPTTAAEEALSLLESLFFEIDAARSAADQQRAPLS